MHRCLVLIGFLVFSALALRAEAQTFPALESPPPADYGAPPIDFENDPGTAPPWLALPHPDLYEQLWHPGDLVEDTYFLRRPWHAGFFFGTMDGDSLTSEVDQTSDWFGGVRFGNDFAPTWGWEVRSAFFQPDITYADGAPNYFARDWFLDLNVLHYPFGDTRIRPFWSIGLGASQFKFIDENDQRISEWLVDLPLSIGCKYHYKPWLVLRGELTDTIVFGNENVDTMSNLSLSVGAEIHWHSFKTRPVRYTY
jgi:hypothetical protein